MLSRVRRDGIDWVRSTPLSGFMHASPSSTRIHGHEVIAMMLESSEIYTRESLVAAIGTRFGANALFYTCSAEGMTAEELVDFLHGRAKFTPRASGFAADAGRICQH